MSSNNSTQLQSVISDDLFPNVQHISDVKQVLEQMRGNAQSMREEQLKAVLFLEAMGNNKYLHEKNPYKSLVDFIKNEGRVAVSNPDYYLDTIEALIPKPPKPVILAEKGMKK